MAILKNENRQRGITASQMHHFPYNCIFIIEISFAQKEGSYGCTGFLIAPNLLLTLANFFFQKDAQIPSNKTISIRSQGINITFTAQNLRINKTFKQQTESQTKSKSYLQLCQFDFALIKLPQKIYRPKYFNLKTLTQQHQEQVSVCGFVVQEKFKLYEHSNKIKMKNDVGYYDIDTRLGQGGSPVFFSNQKSQVVGIHKGSASGQKRNYCCPVTDYLIQTVETWKQEWDTIDQQEQQIVQMDRDVFQINTKQLLSNLKQQNYVLQGSLQKLYKEIEKKNDFSKLQIINLEGEQMQDSDVKWLQKCQLQNLKEINLNDNHFSLAAVVQLVYNEWDKKVNYILDSVRTKKGGYALNVGKNIPTMKSFIKNKSICLDQIDKFKDSKELYESLYLMMEMPYQSNYQQIKEQSAAMQLNMRQAIKNKNNQDSVDRLLITLKQILGNSEVTFTQQSNIKSQLTLKILTLQMMNKRVMIKHKIKDKQWNFKQFKKNSRQVIKFKQWYLSRLTKKYGTNDVTIHKLTEGSVDVWVSVDSNSFLLKNQLLQDQQIIVLPFFQSFNLSPDDFACAYNYQYPQADTVNHYQRAGIPFFQPIYCTKFALKVQNLYDRGNNNWLRMCGHPQQWGVAFHGIKQPEYVQPGQTQSRLQSIMSGRCRGQMLHAGQAQAYMFDPAVNRTDKQFIGRGIYVSPYFSTCLLEYTEPTKKTDQKYHVLLMARFRPEVLNITSRPDYWVINQSRDLRPYAILLFTPEQYQKIQVLGDNIYLQNDASDQKHNMPCHWDNWKQKYQAFRKKNNLK